MGDAVYNHITCIVLNYLSRTDPLPDLPIKHDTANDCTTISGVSNLDCRDTI